MNYEIFEVKPYSKDYIYVLRIRYEVYINEGVYLKSRDDLAMTMGQIRVMKPDIYDKYSILLLLKIDGVPVGTIRLTPRDINKRYYIELENENIDIILILNSDTKVYEVGRFAVLKAYRYDTPASLILWAHALKKMVSQNSHFALCEVVDRMAKYFSSSGFKKCGPTRPWILDNRVKAVCMKLNLGGPKTLRQKYIWFCANLYIKFSEIKSVFLLYRCLYRFKRFIRKLNEKVFPLPTFYKVLSALLALIAVMFLTVELVAD